MVRNNNIGSRNASLGAICSQGKADVGLLQHGLIVSAIAGGRNDLAELLQGLDEEGLVIGSRPPHDFNLLHTCTVQVLELLAHCIF